MNNNLKNNKPKWIPKTIFMKIDNNIKNMENIDNNIKEIDINQNLNNNIPSSANLKTP
jgi:hypothetical protein